MRGVNAFPPGKPLPLWRKLLWPVIAGLAVYILYSGLVWNWFSPLIHKNLINKYAGQNHLDPLWIMAIIKAESGFSPGARSARGAIGLMQLLPKTARELAPEVGIESFHDQDLKDPDINLRIGSHYLTKLRRIFPDDDVAVLAAYNAGPGVTREWLRGKPELEPEDIPYPETRRFVRHVHSTYHVFKILQSWKRRLPWKT